MDIYVLDQSFNTLSYVVGFESLLWTDRYFGVGEFEIYTPLSADFLENIKPNYYLWNSESEHMMIVEDISVDTDPDTGNHIRIIGRSLELILERRVIDAKTSFVNANPWDAIAQLLVSHFENSTNSTRFVSNFKHEIDKTKLPEGLPVNLELYGETVLEVITKICKENNVGFKIVTNNDNELVFSLYNAEDRSYNQDINPYVIFSNTFQNLVNTEYTEAFSDYRNSVLVKGEENHETGHFLSLFYDLDGASGLERRETFVDAGDIRTSDDNDNSIPESQYVALLQQRGKETLEERKILKQFEGAVESHNLFIFGRDYFMGDIVQITTPTGLEASARITEVVRSYSTSSIDTVPTFEIIE